KGRGRSCCSGGSRWEGKSFKGQRKEVIHFRFSILDFGLPARVRNSNPAHRQSRKSWSGVHGYAAQHRIYGRRPVVSAVWVSLGKIGKMGRTLGEMWSCASGQTFELHESQRVSSFRSCAVLQNSAATNSGRSRRSCSSPGTSSVTHQGRIWRPQRPR